MGQGDLGDQEDPEAPQVFDIQLVRQCKCRYVSSTMLLDHISLEQTGQ